MYYRKKVVVCNNIFLKKKNGIRNDDWNILFLKWCLLKMNEILLSIVKDIGIIYIIWRLGIGGMNLKCFWILLFKINWIEDLSVISYYFFGSYKLI